MQGVPGFIEVQGVLLIPDQDALPSPSVEEVGRRHIPFPVDSTGTGSFGDIEANHAVGILRQKRLRRLFSDHIIRRSDDVIQPPGLVGIEADPSQRCNKSHALLLLSCYTEANEIRLFLPDHAAMRRRLKSSQCAASNP